MCKFAYLSPITAPSCSGWARLLHSNSHSKGSEKLTILSDLLKKYWLTPLMELSFGFLPSLTALPEPFEVMRSGLISQLPSDYDAWVDLRESYSQQVLQWYSKQADAYNKATNSYLSEPMVIMLCRKASPEAACDRTGPPASRSPASIAIARASSTEKSVRRRG